MVAKINHLRIEHNISDGMVKNADETAALIDSVTGETVDVKSASFIKIRGTGKDKDRITLMLGIMAGTVLKPF